MRRDTQDREPSDAGQIREVPQMWAIVQTRAGRSDRRYARTGGGAEKRGAEKNGSSQCHSPDRTAAGEKTLIVASGYSCREQIAQLSSEGCSCAQLSNLLDQGQVVTLRTPGGGGWGPSGERPESAHARDRRLGYAGEDG